MKRISIIAGLALAFLASGYASAAEIKADIKVFQFKPKDIMVKVGDTVTWTNGDDIEHSVTAGKPGKETGDFDSGFFVKDGTYSFTFTKPGAFEFFCKRHPSMKAKVVVSE
jgi:plastocyanin